MWYEVNNEDNGAFVCLLPVAMQLLTACWGTPFIYLHYLLLFVISRNLESVGQNYNT